jgi:hypothetical protein
MTQSAAFQAAREAHLRSIGREDTLTAPESEGGLHDEEWVERELARLDAEDEDAN